MPFSRPSLYYIPLTIWILADRRDKPAAARPNVDHQERVDHESVDSYRSRISRKNTNLVLSSTMIGELSEQYRVARELAAGKLKEIESALHDADNIDVMEVVQHTMPASSRTDKELQDDLNLRGELAAGRLRQAAGSSVQAAADAAATTVRAGAARAAGNLTAAKTIAAEKGGTLVRSGASGVAAGFGVANEALAGFARNLDWSTIDPTKYLYAGTRGVSRGLGEARVVWESIPEQLRALGPEEVTKRLEGSDWSHIFPHSKGGGNDAANGIFEFAGLNRSRSSEPMTGAEIEAAAKVLSETAFKAALKKVASQVFTGAIVGAVISCVVSCLEFGLEYQRGEITRDEMYQRLGRAVATSAGVGAAVSGVMAVVALAFPALIPLAARLMVPLAVLGFCAVGGKVVRLGKGWYELYQDVSGDQLSDAFPVTNLPMPEMSTSE